MMQANVRIKVTRLVVPSSPKGTMTKKSKKFMLGVLQNCYHFHEHTQHALGGKGQESVYAFF